LKRRDFITLIGGTAAWPLAARAQQNFRRIGVLMTLPENSQEGQAWVAAFKDGLQRVGWSESRNVRIDARWGATDAASQRLSTEVIATQPDLIVAQNTPTTLALLKQTTTIPIIFANVADPVGSGLVAGLSQPGGNVTGFINIEGSMSGKWLELLREMVPPVNRVAFLFNPATAPYFEYYLKPFRDAAQSFAVEAIAAPVHDKAELESVITAQAQQPNSGLIVMPDSFNINNRRKITSLTARYRFPAVYPQRIYPEVGGLIARQLSASGDLC
jgi:putative tryptophan/tyrosine transport system substrate-binding protein